MDVERDSPEVHVRLAELFTAVGKLDRDEPLHKYLRQAVSELPPVSSIDAANAELLQRNGGSPTHILAAARALLITRGAEAASEIEGLVFQLVHEETRIDFEVRPVTWSTSLTRCAGPAGRAGAAAQSAAVVVAGR